MIKKFFELLFIIIILIVGYNGYLIYEDKFTFQNKQLETELQTLQSQVNQLSKTELKDEIVKIKLNTLHNPEIINNKLEEISKLLVYKGEINYTDYIEQASFWGSKDLTLNLKYNFGISYELSDIVIDNFYENTVVIKLPKDKLELEYIEINESSKIKSGNSLLVAKFTPEETKIIFDQAQSRVKEKAVNDRNAYDKAFNSLKRSLERIILQLGYDKVVFDVI